MDTEQKYLEKKTFIEDVGVLFEAFSLPRMAGRILGWLMVCIPPYQTAGELMTAIGSSKGSISTMTRLLIQFGLVERVGIPEKKGICYRIKPGSWIELLRNRMGFIKAMRELADRGLALMRDEDAQQCQRLQEIHDLYTFVEKETPMLFERWKTEQHEFKKASQFIN